MNRRLSNYTTRDLIVVDWMQEMGEAFGIMKANEVNHLPVVDENGAIVGVLSDRDFRRVTPLAQAEGFARVREFMSWPVEGIEESASVVEAARMMIDKKISSLIVARGKSVVGIVTSEDLLRAFLDSSSTSVVADVANSVKEGVASLAASASASTIGQIAHQLANVGL